MLFNDIRQINEELKVQNKQIQILDDKSENFFALSVLNIKDVKKPVVLIEPLLLSRGNWDEKGGENKQFFLDN